jgi:hypothetical protein
MKTIELHPAPRTPHPAPRNAKCLRFLSGIFFIIFNFQVSAQPPTNKLNYCCDKDLNSFYDHGGIAKHLHIDLGMFDGYITYQTLYDDPALGIYTTLNTSDIYGSAIHYVTPPVSHNRFLIYDPILGQNNDVKIMSLINLSDGYLATGIHRDQSITGAMYKTWLMRLDASFNIVNQVSIASYPQVHVISQNLALLSNGDYFLTGFITEDFTYPYSTNFRNGMAIRLDPGFNILWATETETYTIDNDNDMLVAAKELSDGNILVTGSGNQTINSLFIFEPGVFVGLIDGNSGLLMESRVYTDVNASGLIPIATGRDIFINRDEVHILINSRGFDNFGLAGFKYNPGGSPYFQNSTTYGSNIFMYHNTSLGGQFIGTSLIADLSGNNNDYPVVSGLKKDFNSGFSLNTLPFLVFFDKFMNVSSTKIYPVSSTTYANTVNPFFYPFTYVIPAIYSPNTGIANTTNDGYALQGYHDDPGANNNILQVTTDKNGRLDYPCTETSHIFTKVTVPRTIVSGQAAGLQYNIQSAQLICVADLTSRDWCALNFMKPSKKDSIYKKDESDWKVKRQYREIEFEIKKTILNQHYHYNIYTVLGQLIDRGSFENELKINLDQYASGIYIIQLAGTTKNEYFKINNHAH